MIRRCFNDSAFLWQRACRGWPPRRPASVSSGGGECIERPAAILVDTQPRFSGMNFSVCARACIYPCHSRALPVLLSTLPFLLPDAHTRDRPLLSSHAGENGSFYSIWLLHLPFPPLPLSFHSTGAHSKTGNNAMLSIFRIRHETLPNLDNSDSYRSFILQKDISCSTKSEHVPIDSFDINFIIINGKNV